MKKNNLINSLVTLFLVTVLLTSIFSCSDNAKNSNYTVADLNEQLVMATLWMQNSAEYRALCYQTYNLAKMNLDKALSAKKSNKS